ncbi:hypothetical protein EX30DRAFT_398198 [Ascodesmis nigricans]|uniref:Allergen n=1 Tax=Ascodesmis nigricans TaxID=341454 RepID=A0A4S2MLQ1_9PEZI|nr:hypothetical protein EX30DRAFT_398198 [Ascodesmis nigricans]
MNSIKNAAKDFLHRDGHNTTEASQDFRPAVTQNYIQPTSTSQQTTALDRETHQHHYQTRLQPVRDLVEREAEHVDNVLPVEERVVREGNPGVAEKKLAEERELFQPSTQTLPATHSTLPSTTQTATHTHHHIHETIQPVIEREIIEPTVVHTTKPVHETVEKAPQVHPPTVQPVMTMEEFQRDGGRGGAGKGNYTTTTPSTAGAGNRNNITNKNNMNTTSNPAFGTSNSAITPATPATAPATTTPTTSSPRTTGATTTSSTAPLTRAPAVTDGPGSSISAPYPNSNSNNPITNTTRNASLSSKNNIRNDNNPRNNNVRNDRLHHNHQNYGSGGKDPRYIARDGMRDHGQNALPIVREGRLGGALS